MMIKTHPYRFEKLSEVFMAGMTGYLRPVSTSSVVRRSVRGKADGTCADNCRRQVTASSELMRSLSLLTNVCGSVHNKSINKKACLRCSSLSPDDAMALVLSFPNSPFCADSSDYQSPWHHVDGLGWGPGSPGSPASPGPPTLDADVHPTDSAHPDTWCCPDGPHFLLRCLRKKSRPSLLCR